jgi:glycosyltransferase involved in cell wall biosynthesis
MSNKTILHLTGMTSTKYGGLEHYLLETAKFCRQKGYSTIVQYETLPKSPIFLRDLEAVGAKVVVLDTHARFLVCIGRLINLLRSTRPYVLQTHFPNRCVLFMVPWISRLLGVHRVISMVHFLPGLKKHSLVRFALGLYDAVLGISGAVVDDLLDAGVNPKITALHYLGLFGCRERSSQLRSQLRRELGIPDEAIVLACIAFDSPIKGLDILLAAFKHTLDHHPDVHLVIVGVEPAHSNLPDQAAQLGLTGHVHWPGIRDEGWRILNTADIYVQPSRSEGIALAIMEAMALRLPVVGTQTGGIPEAVVDGETGYLAAPADIDSMAQSIEHALSEPAKWSSMGKAGYHRYLQLFQGENSVRTLVEKYDLDGTHSRARPNSSRIAPT